MLEKEKEGHIFTRKIFSAPPRVRLLLLLVYNFECSFFKYLSATQLFLSFKVVVQIVERLKKEEVTNVYCSAQLSTKRNEDSSRFPVEGESAL